MEQLDFAVLGKHRLYRVKNIWEHVLTDHLFTLLTTFR